MTDAIAKRYEHYRDVDPNAVFYAWNRLYLQDALCGPGRDVWKIYDDFYVFDPPSQTTFPPYRHLPHIRPPTWFRTNNFGWRGPDIALNKPAQTIRIAFLGSSKTLDMYGQPHSHIEYIQEWLNLWMKARRYPYRVEVINASRTGISDRANVAILIDEVLPLEPDLVIDDGANDFAPGLLLTTPAPPPPGSDLRRRDAVARGRPFRARPPAPRRESLNTHALLDGYERMRRSLEAEGGQLALPSWVFMAKDGLRLQLPKDISVYHSLNHDYYPLTYSETRLLADYYNRVFRKYAERHGLLFLDMAAVFPLDPELFIDTVHMTPQGLRLESWYYLQMIVPWLEKRIANGTLPRIMKHPRDHHPALQPADYPIVTRQSIQESCH